MEKGLWGFIDKNGSPVISFQYQDAQGFANGMALVAKNRAYFLISKKGKIIKKLESPEEEERKREKR